MEFDHEQTVTAVKSVPYPASVRWTLDGKEASGAWFPLDAASKDEVVSAPPNLRRAATQEFKLNHFQYMWLDANPDMGDLRNHPEEWDIRLKAEFQGASLYSID